MTDPEFSEIIFAIKKLGADKGKHYSSGSITELELDEEFIKLGVTPPRVLRQWLLLVNGIALPATDLYGIGTRYKSSNIVKSISAQNKYRERGLLPIGGDGCGNDYVIEIDNGENPPVVFTESSESWIIKYIVASSFTQFLKFVIHESKDPESQEWPFDKKFMMLNDPKIITTAYPMPWDA
jgi:hypothetical protein